jgi:hypothetical protein
MELMVDLSRQVAEGALAGNDSQRAEALRLLGIGLYLSGRQDGAERVFGELVRLRPRTNLDPRITRPEVVAFYQDVKRRNQPKKNLALAFLPPLGQFQNDNPGRGWIFGAIEAASLATYVTTWIVLEQWVHPDRTCQGTSNPDPCKRLKLLHYVGAGTFYATLAIGIADGLLGHYRSSEQRPRLALSIAPGAAALTIAF